jgi:hypothetical protein
VNNEQAGNMFKIGLQKRNIQILQFDVHAGNGGKPFNAKVYTREGDYSGYDKDASAWTLIQEVFDLTSLGKGNLTPLPPLSSGSVVLRAGSTHSFYDTLITPTTKYTNGVVEGAKHSSSNNDIVFFEGLGKKYTFGNSFLPRGSLEWTNLVFNPIACSLEWTNLVFDPIAFNLWPRLFSYVMPKVSFRYYYYIYMYEPIR